MAAETTTDSGNKAQHTAMFVECVTMYAHQAMIAMGKLVNPFTKKAERNMEAARLFIDMVEMLEAKTKGNLSKEEERYLGQTLGTLRLTYVEEMKNPTTSAQPEEKPETGAEPSAPAPEPKPEDAAASAEEESKKRFTKKYE